MNRFLTYGDRSLEPALDSWRSMPEAVLPRWESMSSLVTETAGATTGRVAMLGYPNPRAAVRVLASTPAARGAALISPVPGFSERALALANRIQLAPTVLALRGDPRCTKLRARYFDLVVGRIPIDDSLVAANANVIIADHVLEMIRIAAPHALLLLHLTMRTGLPEPSPRAATISRWLAELMNCAGIRRAYFGTSVTRRVTGTFDVFGWARLGDAG